jgi:integrase
METLTLATFIGLLAATGLRPREAAALKRDDADLEAYLLTIRKSKFGKSRLVPLHPSTAAALKHYAEERDRVFHHRSPHAQVGHLFGTRVGGMHVLVYRSGSGTS